MNPLLFALGLGVLAYGGYWILTRGLRRILPGENAYDSEPDPDDAKNPSAPGDND